MIEREGPNQSETVRRLGVARLIRDGFGVGYHEVQVWKVPRAIKWSPQRPVGKARERNEAAIRQWKQVTWPAIINPIISK